MKLLLENWREFLKEGIDPRIQKQIDNLFALPEVNVSPETWDSMRLKGPQFPTNVAVAIEWRTPEDITVFYCLIDKESGEFVRRTREKDSTKYISGEEGRKVESTGIPHGQIIVESPDEESRQRWGDPPCLNGFSIASAKTTRGWGPLLYEVALEWASQGGRAGLMADRRGVSDYAVAVWDKYLARGDVDKKQLDIDPAGAKQFHTQQLTPDIPEDDCSQRSAARRGGSDGWQDTSVSKLYNKPNAEVMSALGARLVTI